MSSDTVDDNRQKPSLMSTVLPKKRAVHVAEKPAQSVTEKLESILDTLRYCDRCGMPFLERNNLGVWRCQAFHPGLILAMPTDTRLSCCGKSPASRGCVRADHIRTPLFTTKPTTITAHAASLLDIDKLWRDESWKELPGGRFDVDRLDIKTFRRRQQDHMPQDHPLYSAESYALKRNKIR